MRSAEVVLQPAGLDLGCGEQHSADPPSQPDIFNFFIFFIVYSVPGRADGEHRGPASI